jgi:hypothetical protein
MNKFSFTISARVGNHIAIRYLCFNDIYPCCIHKEGHLVKLVIFFLIQHVVNSDNSLFARNNNVFFLVFRIKYVKHLCNSWSENSRFIFMTHISLSQQLWTRIHPPQYHVGASPIDIWIQGLVKTFHNWLPKFLQCTHNKHFLSHAIFCIYSDSTILSLTPIVLCLGIECETIYVIHLPWFNHTVWTSSQQINYFFF